MSWTRTEHTLEASIGSAHADAEVTPRAAETQVTLNFICSTALHRGLSPLTLRGGKSDCGVVQQGQHIHHQPHVKSGRRKDLHVNRHRAQVQGARAVEPQPADPPHPAL